MRQLLVVSLAGFLAAPAAADTIIVGPGLPITTIQGGIDAANDGDIVSVAAGVYNEDLTNTKTRLTIRGASRETVVVNGEVTFTGAKRCLLMRMTINGTLLTVNLDDNSHGNRLFDLAVFTSDPGGIGILIDGNQNSVLKSGIFDGDAGIQVNGSRNVVFGCLVDSAGGSAYDIGGRRNLVRSSVAVFPGDDGFEYGGEGNTLFKCASFGGGGAGFRIGGDGSLVTKALANGNSESGLTIEGDGNLIGRCLLDSNGGPGIIFDDANGNLVGRCIVVGNNGDGITLGIAGNATDNRLEKNKIVGNSGAGILLSSSNNADDNWLEKNGISLNTGNAITVQSDHNVLLRNRGTGNGGGLVDNGNGNNLEGNAF